MDTEPNHDVTLILHQLSERGADRRQINEQLYEAVYNELRRMAGGLMRRERENHTLQPTALVHEVYLRLVDQTRAGWENRAHFYGIAARASRQILVDHARRHGAQKRGGDRQRVTLDENLPQPTKLSYEVLALHDALQKLEKEDERMAKVVELRVFAGMYSREAALVLGVSKRTVDADWQVAKMWLSRELAPERHS